MIYKPLLAAALALLLSACATGPRVIDTVVTTQSAHAPGTELLRDARYRFADDASTTGAGQPPITQLQAIAAAALARVGAVRDDANATLTAQVGGQVVAHWVYSYPGFGYPGWGYPYPGWGYPYGGWGYGGMAALPDATLFYLSEVSLVLRDAKTGQIVYDTRAQHDGLRADDAVFTALFTAALQGYPTPPAGARRVDIPLIPIAPPAPPAPGAAPGATPAPAAQPSATPQAVPPTTGAPASPPTTATQTTPSDSL